MLVAFARYSRDSSFAVLGAKSVDERAAALDQDDVAPAAVLLADSLASAQHTETGPLVQGETGGVLGEDARLDGPDPGRLGGVSAP